MRVLEEEPEPVSDLRPDLPAELARIVLRLMSRDPDQRHSTAHALLIELQKIPLAPRT